MHRVVVSCVVVTAVLGGLVGCGDDQPVGSPGTPAPTTTPSTLGTWGAAADGAAPGTDAGGTTAPDPALTTAAPTTAAPTTAAPTTAAPATAAPTTAAPTTAVPAGPPPPARETVAALVDPASIAATLVAAEEAVRDPATPPEWLPGWALAQQVGYRVLGRHPELLAPVLAATPEAWRSVVEANASANLALGGLVTPRTELPSWHIVTPPPPHELLELYRAAAQEFGIDWTYLAAIHLVETRMGRIRGTSTAGAQGPMQFLPSTWEAYGAGGDINDPGDAITAAARYLAAAGTPDDMDRALYAYDHSDHYVRALQAYASVMRADPTAYTGYWHWQVFYRMEGGDVVLPEGWQPGQPTA